MVPTLLRPTCERESNWISDHFPKRDELLFRTVLALPNASRIGLASSTFYDDCYYDRNDDCHNDYNDGVMTTAATL